MLGSSIDELVDRRHVVELAEFQLHETLGTSGKGCMAGLGNRSSTMACGAFLDYCLYDA